MPFLTPFIWLSIRRTLLLDQGSYSLNLPCNFPDQEKAWKMEIKSGKMVKSLEFYFQSHNKSFISVMFFFCVSVQPYKILHVRLQRIMNKALFLRFLMSLLRGEGQVSWFLAWLGHLHEWLERTSFEYSVIQLSLRLTPLGSALSVRLRVVSVLQRIK